MSQSERLAPVSAPNDPFAGIDVSAAHAPRVAGTFFIGHETPVPPKRVVELGAQVTI